MSPFSWNLPHKENEYYTNDDKKVIIPWAKTAAKNLMTASIKITAHFAGNHLINWGLAWLDTPIQPNFRLVASASTSSCVRSTTSSTPTSQSAGPGEQFLQQCSVTTPHSWKYQGWDTFTSTS